MGAALKGSKNPYFKSTYADLGAVLEACKDLLNQNGIVILQPHGRDAYGTFVETQLLHESGEWISSVTPVIFSKEGDPQAQGSAITYARRYGLQSLLSMPAEDDDGEKAMTRNKKEYVKKEVLLDKADLSKPQDASPEVFKNPGTLVETGQNQEKPRTTFRKPKPEIVENGQTTNDLGL